MTTFDADPELSPGALLAGRFRVTEVLGAATPVSMHATTRRSLAAGAR